LADLTGSKRQGVTAGVEQRKAPRKRVLRSSKIVCGDGACVLDCTIRDISATGARITLNSRRAIPANLFLLDMADRIAYEALVVSERAGGYGLKFLKTHPLAAINAPELRYLKRLWIELAR
jgi:hypothetical protein